MNDLLKSVMEEFINTIGIYEKVSPYFYLSGIVLIVLGIVACVFGFQAYQIFFSVVVFGLIAEIFLGLMVNMDTWGNLATYTAVLGIVLAFMGYRSYKLGGFVICALMGMCLGWICYPSIYVAIVFGILAGIFEMYFPVIAISVMTSCWGACILAETFDIGGALYVVLLLGIAVISIAWQLFINRKQKKFPKTCPDKVRYWWEQRRA